jgi:hypothetical protein
VGHFPRKIFSVGQADKTWGQSVSQVGCQLQHLRNKTKKEKRKVGNVTEYEIEKIKKDGQENRYSG